MGNAFDILAERGFIAQNTGEGALRAALGESAAPDSRGLTFYVGFDPTADSLHCGSLVPIMAMAHMQRAGHRPVAIIGGGTAMIGDPSGKTHMRRLLTREEIDANGVGIKAQLQRYLSFESEAAGSDGSGPGALFVNNADWLLPLNYVEFLRDIGRHFKVNEMLRAEAYRGRLEREEGLSFLEFNYQLLQAYDFLVLSRMHDCLLQMGGDDQWGNILAGSDLIRKLDGRDAHGLTFPLLTTARGEKMGKTAAGAVWLAAERTSPYEFYQYWINTDDRDVARFLAYFTFLPMDEVNRLATLRDAEINTAKEVLAFEATKLAHGEAEAERARTASRSAFGGGADDLSAIPSSPLARARLAGGIPVLDLLIEVGFADSKSAARRLIAGGGAYVNGDAITEPDLRIGERHIEKGAILLRYGKKRYHRLLPGE